VDVKFDARTPPRRFSVGNAVKFEMRDCGSLHLEPDEQVTFVTEAGGEFDVARKDWGFYATPSLNGRLEGFGLRAVLIRNRMTDRYFVLLVERGKESSFNDYLAQEHCEVVAWLDTTAALSRLRTLLTRPEPGASPA
jgi:hypothetical protein